MSGIKSSYYDPELTLREDVADVGISETYLSQFFKEQTGVTFAAHLTRLRAEKAREILLSDRWSVVIVFSIEALLLLERMYVNVDGRYAEGGSVDMSETLQIKTLSSLEKLLPGAECTAEEYASATALQGEVFSFQIAFKGYGRGAAIRISKSDCGGLEKYVRIRRVGLAPSELPCYPDHDENVLACTPGLFPDPLYPLPEAGAVRAYHDQWRSVWITVTIPENLTAGAYGLRFEIDDLQNRFSRSLEFSLQVVEGRLPEQQLINTHWFHADCLAGYYGLDIFSDEHWTRIEQQFRNCTAHGINMILTPVFTPPLDTAVGGERPTTQLVKVKKTGETYQFDLSMLGRWIDLAIACGFSYLEISHLTTQWGAEFCPKIIAEIDGEEQKIFGWHTKALSAEYLDFLDQLLPELDAFFSNRGVRDRVYFHVSDEPGLQHLDQYRRIAEEIRNRLQGYQFIDALSSVEFYRTGAVPTPIPANNHIEPFVGENIDRRWTYFCCSQYKEVPNRFFSMPSARNRIMGFLMYKYRIDGFLQWGYNFYYSQYSTEEINPYAVTDALGAFPSGDAFLVYPGKGGPLDSIRHEVFFEAIQDLGTLQLLESLSSRDEVLTLLEGGLSEPLSFTCYPADAEWLLDMRERINRKIAENAS